MEWLEYYFDFVIYTDLENHGSERSIMHVYPQLLNMFVSFLFGPQNCVLFLRSYRHVLHILYVVHSAIQHPSQLIWLVKPLGSTT